MPIRNCAQAGDAIVHACPRGQHQNRNGVFSIPHLAQHRQSIGVGQTEVEDDRRIARGRKHVARIGGGRHAVRLISRGLETLGDKPCKLLVILDDENAHR